MSFLKGMVKAIYIFVKFVAWFSAIVLIVGFVAIPLAVLVPALKDPNLGFGWPYALIFLGGIFSIFFWPFTAILGKLLSQLEGNK